MAASRGTEIQKKKLLLIVPDMNQYTHDIIWQCIIPISKHYTSLGNDNGAEWWAVIGNINT